MGNSSSTSTSPLQTCLTNVFPNNPGAISLPSDLLYQLDAVKVYNTAIPITPAAVVRPSTSEEVAQVVQCAVASGIKVQPRSGGHSFANYCLGGVNGALVVDLENFQQFSMDNTTWYATFGAGTLLGDLTTRLYDNGQRAIAHGTCPQVGTGGHLTIGGLGPLSRQYGSALDHVEEVEVVLANGTITRANNQTNSDIFFALKGAGASFGIITEFVVHTEPSPGNMIQYSFTIETGDASSFVNTFATWQDIIKDPSLDRKLSTELTVTAAGMVISGMYFGTQAEYEALGFEQRLSANATVTTTTIDSWLAAVANWAETEALQLFAGTPASFYANSLAFTESNIIPYDGIQQLFQYIQDTPKDTLAWFIIFDLEGGAINDVPQNATAYAHRDTVFYIQSYAVGIPSLTNTTRAFVAGINPLIEASMNNVTLGAYPGYVDPMLQDAQEAYWGPNLPRLEQIKAQIDPNDVFHNPQSVRPAGSS